MECIVIFILLCIFIGDCFAKALGGGNKRNSARGWEDED